MSAGSELTKIRVDLPNYWRTGGESLWARPLGDDLYAIENVPFHAYGLNYGDVVFATTEDADRKPEIRRVVRRRGHRTLRIFFDRAVGRGQQEPYLAELNALGATYERATENSLAIDIAPGMGYEAVYELLARLEEQALPAYETCEARAEGFFDDGPVRDSLTRRTSGCSRPRLAALAAAAEPCVMRLVTSE